MKLTVPDQIMMDGRPITPAMRQWMTTVSQELWPSPWFNVRDYGAKGDGTTDDTSAINAAYTAIPTTGGILYFPAGTYKVTATLTTWTKKMTVLGAGPLHTIISTNQATGDIVYIEGEGIHITGLKFTASVTRSSGYFIHLYFCNNILIDWCRFSKHIGGIKVNAGVCIDLRDLWFTEPKASTGIGVLVGGSTSGVVDLSIRSSLFDTGAGSAPSAGIWVESAADVVLHDLNLIAQGNSLVIAPGASQSVFSLYATNCFFDSASRGLLVQPSSTGTVARNSFIGCWFCSHIDDGVSIIGGGSTKVDGFDFVGCHFFDNDYWGLDADDAINIKLLGCELSNNAQSGAEFTSCTYFSVLNCVAGTYGDWLGNSSYGISVGNASCDYFIIAGNDLIGNTSGAIYNGSTGTNWHIFGNLPTSEQSYYGSNLGTNVAGKGFVCKEGSNARMGQSTLVAGTVTVSNTSITANTRIFLSRSTTGGTEGHLSTTRTASTSFVINSSNAADTSTIDWLLVEPS